MNNFRGVLWNLARILVLVFILVCIGIFIAEVAAYPRYAAEHMEDFVPYAPVWNLKSFHQVLAHVGLTFTDWRNYRFFSSILNALVFCSVGLFIFFRKRNDWFGLYIAFVFVLFGTISFDASRTYTGAYPILQWLIAAMGVLSWWALFQLLFLFPNGKFSPGWTRWIANLLLLLYIFIFSVYGETTPPAPIILLVLALFGIGAFSQVYRYRRISTALERQQTKWVMFAMVIVFCALLISASPMAFPEILRPGASLNILALVLSSWSTFIIPLIPLSFTFAITRYRLWDIDLVIRRTLIYSTLTITLLLVYFTSVILFQQVLGWITGESALAIVLSTLLIAAIFEPARRRVQTFIDRRFFRQKYNAVIAIEEFSFAARSEVGLNSLTTRLLRVVEKTVQPDQVSVWIRKADK